MSKKITCVHLYNDFSGSPRVLSNTIRHFLAEGREVEIMTSAEGTGFLSKIKGAEYSPFEYTFVEDKKKRAVKLLRSQVRLFFKVLRAEKERVIYVNTLLPFGAALAGRLSGKRVVYHLHETTVNPPFLKKFLKWVAKTCASEAIYVSDFLRQAEPLAGVPSRVVPNSLSEGFLKNAQRHLANRPEKTGPFTLLMLCSLKAYKGVFEYVKLAEALPKYRFLLVLNASQEEVRAQLPIEKMPENLIVFPSQKEVSTFYQEADLVLNLSHPEQWVETFGMTLLEGMSYGLPVIAPPVGGPAELVEDGANGYLIDQRNEQELVTKVAQLAENPELYEQFSKRALEFAAGFRGEILHRGIAEAVENKEAKEEVPGGALDAPLATS